MGYTGAGCCGLGAMADTSGYDCVMIPGTNCIKIGLPGKSILGDYFQENRTS